VAEKACHAFASTTQVGLIQVLGAGPNMTAYLGKAGFGNHILYTMCRDHPEHSDPEMIGGKLWLIGRAYSASVERKAGKNFDWAPLKNALVRSTIDKDIATCKQIDRIDKNNLATVLGTHKHLTDIFKAATGLEKRSLASKYLHFHAPTAFFIYDSIAAKKVSGIVRPIQKRFDQTHNSDKAYEIFCKRCLLYRDKFLELASGKPVSPRYLDSRLLGYEAST
jgi:hypothetical protein